MIFPQTSEAELQAMVIDAARWHGWRVCHFRAAQNRDGRWMTPLEGDPGLPDLVLARDGVVLLAELKSDRGQPTEDQTLWLDALGDHGRLWRPADWLDGTIQDQLRRTR